ncbi:MAG: nucleotidyltransferase family protein [Bacteroidales bacterium]|jgi:D-glycero-alpha-D-manno-heptose 1-phosphate guanylyltransferase|nr:nucleotidyltransferase family protein [Bacteroidales bacterium]
MDNQMKLHECIILVGGQGTRLRSVVNDLPKPMALVGEKPFLEYLLYYLHVQGCLHCVLSVGYRHEVIENYFGNQYKNMKLDYAIEEEPLGTGGGVKNSLRFITHNNFFLLNGDSFFDVDLNQLAEFHLSQKSSITLSVKEMHHVDRYGTLDIENDRIVSFNEKQLIEKGFINAGVYVVSKHVFDNKYICKKRFSFEKDILEAYVHTLPFYAFSSDGYFIDIGIPEDYQKAQSELKEVNYFRG